MHALALLLAFGSADTWHGDFHPVSSVPCLAHTAGMSRAGHRVGSMPLILIEAPSSAYRRGMLALGKLPQEEEETSGDSTPSRTSFMVASTCTLGPWMFVS
jgi:hypothetical protein